MSEQMEAVMLEQAHAISRGLSLPWWAFIRRHRETRIVNDAVRKGEHILFEARRALELEQRTCEHDWRYDAEESQGPWTGYIERCVKCNAIQQVPQ